MRDAQVTVASGPDSWDTAHKLPAWSVGQHYSWKPGLHTPLRRSLPALQGLSSNRGPPRVPQGSKGVGRKGWGHSKGPPSSSSRVCSSSEKPALGPPRQETLPGPKEGWLNPREPGEATSCSDWLTLLGCDLPPRPPSRVPVLGGTQEQRTGHCPDC